MVGKEGVFMASSAPPPGLANFGGADQHSVGTKNPESQPAEK